MCIMFCELILGWWFMLKLGVCIILLGNELIVGLELIDCVVLLELVELGLLMFILIVVLMVFLLCCCWCLDEEEVDCCVKVEVLGLGVVFGGVVVIGIMFLLFIVLVDDVVLLKWLLGVLLVVLGLDWVLFVGFLILFVLVWLIDGGVVVGGCWCWDDCGVVVVGLGWFFVLLLLVVVLVIESVEFFFDVVVELVVFFFDWVFVFFIGRLVLEFWFCFLMIFVFKLSGWIILCSFRKRL